ncbi:hypothetical protein MCI89_03975 [Muricomes sp. OA1]|uniref:Prenylated flavin chaperone LpdD-like domain-containing protein n=1 Tax=Hungatella hathewayi TaxID=154046 RepID=A0A3E2X2D2_9FIRM|nr:MULTISPECIES: hypothetical protein [Clostridia]MCH1971504.1 hypothetical protein [Muricomes sp. OA1]MEE0201560.1 hypothetical protein [Muricomes sp.]MSC83922.1 hypothetical protein [Eubacterium sp. BIOML-A1]MSD06288.1 hypothetical protein [Eubacterium sp. BIOML-A2]MRM90125.1 hypothetical protein [Faecalicatena contorta]
MLKEELFDGLSIICEAIRMGKDYTLAVYGGDTPHAGSVVMTVARPSLTGEGIGVTTSVLTGAGHKDDIIARLFSEALAKAQNCTVVCSCGIHVEKLRPEQLEIVLEKCGDLLQRLLGEESE